MLTGLVYDSMEKLDAKTIKVSRNEKYGLLKTDGDEFLPYEYDSIEQLKNASNIAIENCYKVGNDGMYGLFNSKTNSWAAPIEYYNVENYTGDVFACAKSTGTYGCPCDYINSDGNIIYQNENDYPATVKKINDDYYKTPNGITDKYGNIIFETSTSEAFLLDDDHIALVNSVYVDRLYYDIMIYCISEGTYTYLPYDVAYNNLDTDIIAVKDDNDLWGCIDAYKNTIIPFEYDYISSVPNNTFLRFQKNGKYGIMDYQGNEIVPCEYDSLYADYFWGSYSKYEIKGTKGEETYYGWIDENNKLVVPCEYDSVSKYDKGYIVRLGEKYGVIDIDGNMIFEPQFDRVSQLCDKHSNYIVVRKNDKYGLCDFDGNMWIEPSFDYIRYTTEKCGEPLLEVNNDNKCGIISSTGDIIINIDYNSISNAYKTNLFRVCKENGDVYVHGLTDIYGNELLDCSNKIIHLYNNIIAVCNTDGLWGLAKYEEKMPVNVTSSISGNELSVQTENPENYAGTVIAAFYKDGSFINMEQRELPQVNSELKFDVSDGTEICKVFVWDSIENMKPIGISEQVSLNK